MSQLVEKLPQQVTRHRRLRRDQVQQLLELAQHLPDRDRLLLTQVLGHGQSAADVARLMGQPPRRIQRRVARLLRRLRSREYRFVVGQHRLIPEHARATALRVFVHGRSLRHTAEALGLTLHQVRQNVHTVRTLAHL